MLSNILAFTKIHLLGKTGINDLLHPGDDRRAKRAKGMFVLYVILAFAVIMLLTKVSQTLAAAGLADKLPGLAVLIASALIFIFNIFQSGSTVFNLQRFESEMVLPVKPSEIVASRFLVLYLLNLVVSCVITVPILVVCGMESNAGILFVLFSIIGVFLIPLIPVTLALLIGAFVYAVSARVKQRKLITTVLGMVLLVTAFILYMKLVFSGKGTLPDNIASLLSNNTLIVEWYPPAEMFSAGLYADLLQFALFVVISVGLFAAAVALVSWKYIPICQAMQTHDTKHNYVMQEQTTMSVARALFKRDLKRYFSSTPYVFNTAFGYILMIVAVVALMFTGFGAVFRELGQPVIQTVAPFVLAALCGMSATTPASISIEGKHWWITQTLPVSAKTIFSSKLKVNMVVGLPFVLVALIIILIQAMPTIPELVLMVLIPIIYLYFMSVLGLFCGIRHPNLFWSSETEAVKQGPALLITILVGLLFAVAGGVLVFACWDYRLFVLAGFAFITLIATIILRRKINRMSLSGIR